MFGFTIACCKRKGCKIIKYASYFYLEVNWEEDSRRKNMKECDFLFGAKSQIKTFGRTQINSERVLNCFIDKLIGWYV